MIADAARTMPHTLRSLELTAEIIAGLTTLVGFHQDLAAEASRTSNRIRSLLTQFYRPWNELSAPGLTIRPSPGSSYVMDSRPPCEKLEAAGWLGNRGEPHAPEDPARGLVWRAIEDAVDSGLA